MLNKFKLIIQSIDEVAIHCARNEVASFTDLIRTLSSGARSDVDVARAIYRWITIKNLNTMIFDDSIQNDTPMGLLRGIKYGTESYHVLFKRLCRSVLTNTFLKMTNISVTLVFIVSSLKDSQNQLDINLVIHLMIIASETHGTLYFWTVPGDLCSVIGELDI